MQLTTRQRIAISNAGKFYNLELARASRNRQNHFTAILHGEDGQFWVPATYREQSILEALGYENPGLN